ncbi:MAG: hypothetical protein CL609_19465 [Anaerolineaceae bacterium]|nr:hypothetical protein [Anaerolineaceae bacterium]
MRQIFPKRKKTKNNTLLKLIILVLTGAAIFGALILPISSRPSSYQITEGNVASFDIQAPRNITYISEILTKQNNEQIKSSIQAIYLPTDPTIARHQIDRLRKALNYVSLVRSDSNTNQNEKVDDLSALNDIILDKDTAYLILNLSEETWNSIQQESITVLEQSLQNTIRENQVDEIRRKIPALISYSFSQESSSIIEDLISPFIVPNSLYSEELTQNAITETLEETPPINQSYFSGEIIVRRGEVIDDLAFEALKQLNLVNPKDQNQIYFSAAVFSIVVTVLSGIYFYRRELGRSKKIRELLVIIILFLLFVFAAKFLIPNRTILPFIFPIAGFTLALGSLFGFEVSMFLTFVLVLTVSYDMPNFGELVLFYMVPALSGMLVLGQGRRISIFFLAGLVVGVAGSGSIIALRILGNQTDLIGIFTLVLASMFNGMASASLGLLVQYIIAQFLGITTALQLLEIARPDHPLLQHILKKAPGTYQHSLQVANLAEQAAKEIGADQLLTRVGAIYHDVGKTVNPTFFIENQVNGASNPHDILDPYTSAATVIEHVTNGVELAKKYHLPLRIQNFMLEHHGTLLTRYFYVKAIENNGNDEASVSKADFMYPGPPPQSKETALLMLADGCEARARAEKPQSKEELLVVIQKVIDFCQKEGQLNDTELTLKDLKTIANSFTETLINTYHPRIKYPELNKQPVTSDAS